MPSDNPVTTDSAATRRTLPVAIGRGLGVLGLIGATGFHALFTLGAGGLIIPRCDDPFGTCVVIGLQAALALLTTVIFAVAAYRLARALPTAGLVFVGTLPFWLFHIPLKLVDPNEGWFFVIFPAFAPLTAGAVWLWRRSRHSQAPAEPAEPVG